MDRCHRGKKKKHLVYKIQGHTDTKDQIKVLDGIAEKRLCCLAKDKVADVCRDTLIVCLVFSFQLLIVIM